MASEFEIRKAELARTRNQLTMGTGDGKGKFEAQHPEVFLIHARGKTVTGAI